MVILMVPGFWLFLAGLFFVPGDAGAAVAVVGVIIMLTGATN